MNITCSTCQTVLRVSDSFAGKKGKCPKCGAVIEMPVTKPAPEPASAEAGKPVSKAAETSEADHEDVRLSAATPTQVVNSFVIRGEGAILLSFPISRINFDDLVDVDFNVSISENLSETDAQSIVQHLATAWRTKTGSMTTEI